MTGVRFGTSTERERMARGLLFSLLVHALLLLSLSAGGQGLGLPGLVFPWQERRAEAPDLRVVLVQAPAPLPTPAQRALTEPALAPPASAESPASAAGWAATVIDPRPEEALPSRTAAAPAAAAVAAAAWPASPPTDAVAPAPSAAPDVLALAPSERATWLLPSNTPASPATDAPAPPAITAMATEPTPSASSPEAAMPAHPEAASDAVPAQEPAEAQARWEAQKQAEQLAAVHQAAVREEAARQEAARQEAARAEAARQEATRQEKAAQAESARLEAQRQEAARLAAAARQESERQEAARQAAARQEAVRQDAARQEAARAEAARVAEARAAEERREERLRAIGRQLNEEADRRDAAAARRGRLFGRSDANAELVLYAEAWSRKLQLNQTFDLVRDAATQPHTDPLVTVAIRSDGSVESVTFVRSSGVPAIDDAVRRIVQSQANYPAFPPALAREFDVIEIRRTWHFDMAIRLY
jgi:TonB family protein